MKKFGAAFFLLLACGGGERDITVGPDKDTSGNYWGRDVSKEFAEPQLRTLYAAMNSPAVDAEISALNCGKKLPRHEYSVTLWTEGEYRERIVRLQMTPRLYSDDECLQQSVNYVFQKTVKAIDTGPPIDYGYRSAHRQSPRRIEDHDRPSEQTEVQLHDPLTAQHPNGPTGWAGGL
jgi:hypothetical protein